MKRELIFIDTNVVVWLLKGRKSVVDFFSENVGYLASNVIVYLEVMHVVRRLSQRLRHPLDLSPVHDIFSDMILLPIDDVDLRRVGELVTRYNLMPNDAMIAATCEHHGINKIATYDEDFTRIDFLEVIMP